MYINRLNYWNLLQKVQLGVLKDCVADVNRIMIDDPFLLHNDFRRIQIAFFVGQSVPRLTGLLPNILEHFLIGNQQRRRMFWGVLNVLNSYKLNYGINWTYKNHLSVRRIDERFCRVCLGFVAFIGGLDSHTYSLIDKWRESPLAQILCCHTYVADLVSHLQVELEQGRKYKQAFAAVRLNQTGLVESLLLFDISLLHVRRQVTGVQLIPMNDWWKIEAFYGLDSLVW